MHIYGFATYLDTELANQILLNIITGKMNSGVKQRCRVRQLRVLHVAYFGSIEEFSNSIVNLNHSFLLCFFGLEQPHLKVELPSQFVFQSFEIAETWKL